MSKKTTHRVTSKTRTGRTATKPKAGASRPRRNRKWKDYDDDELVMELARGASPVTHIARRVGLHPRTVSGIKAGQVRPELMPRIRAARARLDRRLEARVRRAMLARVRRLVRKGLSSRRARTSREALLDLVLGIENRRYHHEER